MTEEQAIKELTRAVELCSITPFAEACQIAINALKSCRTCKYHALEMWMEPCNKCYESAPKWELKEDKSLRDCANCRHKDRMPDIYPCSVCKSGRTESPSMWEPKER